MDQLPQELSDLVLALSALPSVGQRTGTRYAMSILHWSQAKRSHLAQKLLALENLKNCEECGVFVGPEFSQCHICLNAVRQNNQTICVVENFQDYLAIEKGHYFKGLYHLLGGVLNPMMGIGPEQLSISSLIDRVKTKKFTHVILALNPSMEGDATSSYIAELLAPYCSVERIGFGVPIGAHLEYLDTQTIFSALENRKKMPNNYSNFDKDQTPNI